MEIAISVLLPRRTLKSQRNTPHNTAMVLGLKPHCRYALCASVSLLIALMVIYAVVSLATIHGNVTIAETL
jgi:hypothetical protein